jgi:hypothetical protein
MAIRYYAHRAVSGEWLDTSVALGEPLLSWVMSGPDFGQANRPIGIGNPIADDGRPLFGKWDTILLAEEEDKKDLLWAGICSAANPSDKGTSLEFIGLTGWMAGVPYLGEYQVWQTPLWDAIKELLSACRKPGGKPMDDGIDFKVDFRGGQGYFVGDPKPPPYPELGSRTTHTDEQWEAHSNAVAAAQEAWRVNHGWKTQYELLWWEAPMVGREIDDLVKAYGCNYRTAVRWTNRSKLKYEWKLIFSDDTRTRREDVEFIDGVNLAKPIDVKSGTTRFANRVIGLGAGEGKDMLRVDVGGRNGRLYQAEVIPYKAINNQETLRKLAQADLKLLRSDDIRIETLTVWDMPGFAPISSIEVGNEVRVRSKNTIPAVDSWCRVVSITKDPEASVAVVNFEVAQ